MENLEEQKPVYEEPQVVTYTVKDILEQLPAQALNGSVVNDTL